MDLLFRVEYSNKVTVDFSIDIHLSYSYLLQMEKCRDVTQGYTTQQECDKWPQQICELEKKKVKKYSPETQV